MLSQSQDKTLTFKKIFGLTLVILAISIFFNFPYPGSSGRSKTPQYPLTILGKALFYIQNDYVDPDLVDTEKMLKGSLKALEKGLPPVLVQWKKRGFVLQVQNNTEQFDLPQPLTFSEIKTLMSQVLGFINHHYNGDTGLLEREHIATAGLLESLDPHSNFLPPEVFSEFKVSTKGTFGGLGIVIGLRDRGLTVISALEGTPAHKAGLKAQDNITQIDGESTINMSLTEAVGKLRGKVGTTIQIVVQRANTAEPLSFTLTRALIEIKSVDGKYLKKSNAGLIKIKTFQQDTLSEVKKYINKINQQSPDLKGWILDLRNNPGGLLDQAEKIADLFLSSGVIVSTVSKNQMFRESESANPGDLEEKKPLIVLINEGSASASEIIAGALQIHGRALVIGHQTFGKGSVQTVYDLRDGSALKLTIAKYLLANDIPVQSIGITPDILLQPAIISEKIVDLLENEMRSEKDLEQSFKEEPLFKNHSFYQMSYLTEDAPDEETLETGQVNIDFDFPVLLSQEILDHQTKEMISGRLDLLNAAKQVLPKMENKESEKIKAALLKREVDWSLSNVGGKPKAEISVWITNEQGEKLQELKPGSTAHLHLTVKNTGKGPFEQLIGVIKSKNNFFNNQEFILGRIEAEKNKSWKIPLKVPGFMIKRNEPITINFQEGHDHAPPPFTTTLRIAEPSQPSYAFSYHLLDNGEEGSKGNGDGLAQQGETIILAINIKNTGGVESKETVINLVNKQGKDIFIDSGRVSVKPLAAKSEAKASLKFKIDGDIIKKELKFNLVFLDADSSYSLPFKLNLPINEVPHEPPINTWYYPPHIEISQGDQTLITKKSEATLEGIAKDDIAIKNIIVFNDDSKVYYKSYSQGEDNQNAREFSVTFPLHKDSNTITVLTEDYQGLISQKQWVLWKQ
ncbi:MAG: hypothetical protein A3I75_00990 [Deltaproteobacteria bacterium RIFCSPLOWO2_02_FULL_50_16]|nr:MAG: hypothetical protein A2053_02580 [Deltaproteobacteria bacterium GWA2_50_8]OGQ55873.1 MAG: hypothetical protein A3I75_00990 [Deltaproteobacteria bacterium RIFCSPLOWO2_02_FULL_50_16]OGQ66941.1 MAG: hypothetical protein A3F89_08160 [Deltaproteobacteria bacterium RIFCSPLOWO2_12_FULL_50_11]